MMRCVWLALCVLGAWASRGDELTDQVPPTGPRPDVPRLEKLGDAFAAAHDWFHVTGPSPMVAAMSHRGQLCTIFIFGLAIFAMARQIWSYVEILKRGISQVAKVQPPEAPAPASPAAFLAAAEEEARQQQARLEEFRRLRAAQRRQRVVAAPALPVPAHRRAHSAGALAAKGEGERSRRRCASR
ncbi:unnamed protein product [Effrenium voratum]|nr:unnamed protein product [Effrenium voratum]